MQLKQFVLPACLLFSSSLCYADIGVPAGWYSDGHLGYSHISNVSSSGMSISSNGIGAGFDVGYKFIPYFAFEGGLAKYANSTWNFSGVKVAQGSYYSYDLAGKAILPLVDTGFDFFVKLGYAGARMKLEQKTNSLGITVNAGTQTRTGLYYALGADYWFSPFLMGIFQWSQVQAGGQVGNLELYSVGVGYMFG